MLYQTAVAICCSRVIWCFVEFSFHAVCNSFDVSCGDAAAAVMLIGNHGMAHWNFKCVIRCEREARYMNACQ